MNLDRHCQHKRGIEREALRIFNSGKIATSTHPLKLGSKLTNKNITVDFSEGLLELITEPFDDINKTFIRLRNILAFSVQNLPSNELLLSTSMPPNVIENEIKIADFGYSNSGIMKRIYRQGLAKRYGKIMQTIAGLHYNFSYDSVLLNQLSIDRKSSIDELYFSAINHYFEFMWLVPYLFGASPVCAKNLVKEKPKYLKSLDNDYYIAEHATSLRMSNLGYQSYAQNNLFISYENLQKYADDLIDATHTPYSNFEKIGMYDNAQLRQQLNCNILQIENEYYSTIRPKQITKRCERPASALLNRGVSYLEVRVLDVNPFIPLGIDSDAAYFIEALLLKCLMLPIKKYSQHDIIRNKLNFSQVVTKGRHPKLQLMTKNKVATSLKTLGLEQLELINDAAKLMGKKYHKAVNKQIEKFHDPTKTLSGRLINSIKNSYSDTVINLSKINTNFLKKIRLSKIDQADFIRQVNCSLKEQRKLEKKDINVEQYINNYYRSSFHKI